MLNIDWTAVGGISAAATGLVAIGTLLAARTDSRDRTRPVVIAEYRIPDAAITKRLVFVVRNAGASVARDLEVRFIPAVDLSEKDDLIKRSIVERYRRPIAVLGPGQELANIVVLDLDNEAASDLPHDLTIEVSYRRSRFRRYRDSYALSAFVMAQHTYSTSSDSAESSLKGIRKAVEKIAGK